MSITDPIPADGRLVRAVRRRHEHQQHARTLARIARDTGGNIAHARADTHRFEFPDPVDLRGIPVVGRGIAGVSPGTRPDAICDR